MSQIPIPTTRTLETPYVPKQQLLDFLSAVRDHESLFHASLELTALGESLEAEADALKKAGFNIENTAKALRDHIPSGMLHLLHAMPKTVLHSLVAGTVAYDGVNKNADFFEHPKSQKVPGMYAIGLRVRSDPQGRFLTEGETVKLIEGIHSYIEGYNVISRVGPPTSEEMLRINWVKQVDGAYMPSTWIFKEAMFVSTSPNSNGFETRNLERLARMYERRCISDLQHPDDQVRQLQSPLYVGCSTNLANRLADYAEKNMGKFNKNLGITLSICKVLGVELEMVRRVVLLTWENRHIQVGEQLVTTLADSLTAHSGFNAKEAGDSPYTSGVYHLDQAQIKVLGVSRLLASNVDASLAEMDRIMGFLSDLEAHEKTIKELEECERRAQEAYNKILQMEDWPTVKKRIDARHAALEEKLKEKEDVTRSLEVIDQVLDALIVKSE